MTLKYHLPVPDGYIEFPTYELAAYEAAAQDLDPDTITEVEIVVPAPTIPNVTPRQMRQALVLSGISIATIDDALAGLPEPTRSLATIEWEYSTAFIRANPLVATMGALLGFTSEQLDDMWALARTL